MIVFDRDVAAADDAIQVDVTDAAGVAAAVSEAVSRLGGLDVLVNNAGIGAAGTVEDNSDEEWHRVYDVNVVGMVRMARAALPALRESSSASIVNTCSVAATAGLPQRALYSATKGAVLALTMAMAADHVGEGIRVNCVCPGTADTPWVGRLLDAADDPDAERAALNARQPMGRLVSAQRGRRRRSSTWPPRPPPPARPSSSTEACRTSASENKANLRGLTLISSLGREARRYAPCAPPAT